eukprot:856118-Pyramimonas_sp.AAC.1
MLEKLHCRGGAGLSRKESDTLLGNATTDGLPNSPPPHGALLATLVNIQEACADAGHLLDGNRELEFDDGQRANASVNVFRDECHIRDKTLATCKEH